MLAPGLELEFVLQVLGFVLLTPLLTFVAHRLVSGAGAAVITNYDIAGFVLSARGIVFVLALAALGLGLLTARCAALRRSSELTRGRLAELVLPLAAWWIAVTTVATLATLASHRATPELVRRAHAAGKAVHVRTVDKLEVMLRMIERGVDDVITNDPATLVRVMRDRNAPSTTEMLRLRLRVLFGSMPRELTQPSAVPAL